MSSLCHFPLFFVMVTLFWQPALLQRTLLCSTAKGFVLYNSENSICCERTITQRVSKQECCGVGSDINSKKYFPESELCCANKVSARYVPMEGSEKTECTPNTINCEEQLCCGGKPINKADALCCNNEPVNLNSTQKRDREHFQCCGRDIFREDEGFCCGGVITTNRNYSCCGGKLFHKGIEYCDTIHGPPKKLQRLAKLCGTEVYDVRSNSCCGEILYPVPETSRSDPDKPNPEFACCDSLYMDPQKENCCREHHTGNRSHVIPAGAEISCCGEGHYNTTHQDCYDGQPVEKKRDLERCGSELINISERQCCGDLKSYNNRTHQCCVGYDTNIIHLNQTCCNGVGMDENQEMCCEGVLPVTKDVDDDQCCYNSFMDKGKTYNSKRNERCINGDVQRYPNGTEPCGKQSYYNITTQLCCEGSVVNRTSGWNDCCYDRPYNNAEQRCCNFELYDNNDMENPCMSMCQGSSYDKRQKICCQGVLHRKHRDTMCCGKKTVNMQYKDCCGGQFPYPWDSQRIQCCGDRELYRTKRYQCIDNKVVPRDKKQKLRSDVQQLCARTAGRWSDGWVQYGCESVFVFMGKVRKVAFRRGHEKTTISISLSAVRGLDRGEGFRTWKQESNHLTLQATVEMNSALGVSCRSRFLKSKRRSSKYVFFLNAEPKNSTLYINADASFFFARYNKRLQQLVTSSLSYEFCQKKFNMSNSLS